MERVLVLESGLRVTLELPRPLRGLEQVHNLREPWHEDSLKTGFSHLENENC